MSLLGLHVTVLIGPTVPMPVPPPMLEWLESIEVVHSDSERSGFQIVFKAPRSARAFLDFPMFLNPQFRTGNRVILVTTFSAMPAVLMDGIITNQQLKPAAGNEPATLTLTGEDVSVKMDLEEKAETHPAQPDNVIAMKIIGQYAQYGLIPKVIPPVTLQIRTPLDQVPQQRATDLRYLQEMAARHGYVFYVVPGPVVGANTAYWGPPVRGGIPQPALTVDMGPATNVQSISFEHDATQAATVEGRVQDRTTNQEQPVRSFSFTRIPLAINSPLTNPAVLRRELPQSESGQESSEAQARAQAQADASMDVVKVTGELNAASYGSVLQARGLVGLRGVGFSYDGLYYVKKVTHSIQMGKYAQKFEITREGTGSTVLLVRP
ncbi:MAG: hypothetical protein SF339_17175 [Blastocatellia bacterium]|nr:hypothetical protein [Blastocatellia bacterium]